MSGAALNERGGATTGASLDTHVGSTIAHALTSPALVSSSLDVGFALLSAVALVALTSAVEAGFRSWKAAQRRKRHRGRPASLMSPAASAPSLPKLLGTLLPRAPGVLSPHLLTFPGLRVHPSFLFRRRGHSVRQGATRAA